MLRDLAFRVRALLRRRAVEHELDDELAFHLDKQIEKHVAAGLSPTEAARRARLDLGGLSQVKEECRRARGVSLIEDLVQDARYGARVLRRSPGFTAVALLTLALGIGANTALFSVVDGVLLDPLPYPEPDRLVTFHQSKPNFATGSVPYANFRDWRDQNRTLSAMAVHRSYGFHLGGAGAAEQVTALLVSSDLFPLLGVEPMLGRGLARGEDEVGAAPIALLGGGLWRRRYAESPDVLGRTILLDGRPFTVVGVMPSGFDLFLDGRPRDVYVPIGQWDNDLLLDRGAGLGIHGVGRLAPGVTLEQAQADLDRVTAHLAAVHPEKNRGTGARVLPFERSVVGSVRQTLLILLGAVGLVLLIACVNVANLMLARAAGRAREVAVRMALGASRGRLVRQLLTESMMLALAGGALGVAVAAWATPAALALLPGELPRARDISIDATVLAFALVVSLASGLLFGLVPALKATGSDLRGALADGGRTVRGSRHRVQNALIVVQVAMVLVLLVGAGLMVRTLGRLWSVDPGIDPQGVTVLSTSFAPRPAQSTAAAVRARLRQTEARIKAIPGVAHVSLSAGALPLLGDDEQLFWFDGQPRPATSEGMNWTLWYIVGPEYREAMGIPLLAGRFFRPEDDERAPPVVVIDDVFARQYFGDADPIGKLLRLDGHDRPARVIGLVRHVVQWGLDSDDRQSLRAQMYFPVMQLQDKRLDGATGIDMVVRSTGPQPVPFDAVRAALQEMDPDQVAFDPRAMDEVIAASLAGRRFSMLVLVAFGVLALLLASVGIYGVIAYAVGRRTAEIGVRMALGARRVDVLRLILAQGLRTAMAGIAVGLVAALALTRLMVRLLYGVSATDPVTFAAVAVGLVGVALLASYLPARRAASIEPMAALRHE